MEREKKKALREQYDQRRPEMGIVCWQSGEKMWIAKSTDAKADYNGSLFQLQFGSWPNRELQKAFTEDPGSFRWSLLKKAGLQGAGRGPQRRPGAALSFVLGGVPGRPADAAGQTLRRREDLC